MARFAIIVLLSATYCSCLMAELTTTSGLPTSTSTTVPATTKKPKKSPNQPTGVTSHSKNPCELPNAFRCARDVHLCVNYEQLCDGKMQCPNGADETGLVCALRSCRPDQYDCGFGGPPFARCLHRSKLCNRVKDCVNGADEANCTMPACCDGQFQCSSDHHCISSAWRCDDISDCRDGSDELECNKQKGRGAINDDVDEKTAGKSDKCDTDITDTFYCWSGRRPMDDEDKILDKLYGSNCIPYWFLCNGKYDCVDGADEANCQPATSRPLPSIRR